MKNSYFEEMIASGARLGKAQNIIVRSLLDSTDKLVICGYDFSAETAASMAQQLSLAGIKEVYIHSEWSNQLDAWMAMDGMGLKLRGIEMVSNPEYARDIRDFGESLRDEMVPAFHFSFE